MSVTTVRIRCQVEPPFLYDNELNLFRYSENGITSKRKACQKTRGKRNNNTMTKRIKTKTRELWKSNNSCFTSSTCRVTHTKISGYKSYSVISYEREKNKIRLCQMEHIRDTDIWKLWYI